MNVSRRFFIGGLASALAISPRRIFSAAPGMFSGGKPTLSFGVLSDVHVSFKKGGEVLADSYNTDTLIKAFEWFRDNGADAVVIAGDMAHWGFVGELQAVANAWFRVFPNDKAPDGRHVERVFVFGNHDWSTYSRSKKIIEDKKRCESNLLQTNPRKWWDKIFGEEWTPFFEKNVNGYLFEGAHWCNGWCKGANEQFTRGLREYYESRKAAINPSLPFFHVQHPHPKGTVHGKGVWGQDDGISTEILSAYPNAITFSGHSHTSLTDERSIWQGTFTAIGCGSLRDVSLNIATGREPVPGGAENGKTPKGPDFALYDARKTMKLPDRMNCRQGQMVRVYGDRIVFSRREFLTGISLGNDLVMPLPAAESKPFEFASRAAKALAPEFPAGAKLSVMRSAAITRGAKKSQRRKVDVWKLSIPAASAVRSARAVRYEITASTPGKPDQKFVLVPEGLRFGLEDPRATARSPMTIACDRLPGENLTFTVHAVSCWDKVSRPISVSCTQKD